jgi:fumarate hydratase subunit beta
MKKITLPCDKQTLLSLKAGEKVLVSGEIFTLRDAGHKRLVQSYRDGNPHFLVNDKAFYYCGPTPTIEGEVIGSCGPTTSARMDDYAPFLIEKGLSVMIGKGKRGDEVVVAMKNHGAVYFGAIGGCGALLSKCIKKAEIVAYEDLGAEAIRRLEVEDFPVIVIIDSDGNNLYESGRRAYLAQKD